MSTRSGHTFSARVEPVAMGVGFFALDVPEKVSRALARRGTIPVVVTLNGVEGLRATLIPRRGGRHRIFLNRTLRKRVGIGGGDRVKVILAIDENPIVETTPADLAHALRDVDALGTFERFTRAKRNHIIQWVDAAVMETTREKRIAKTVEIVLAVLEKAVDREARKAKKARP